MIKDASRYTNASAHKTMNASSHIQKRLLGCWNKIEMEDARRACDEVKICETAQAESECKTLVLEKDEYPRTKNSTKDKIFLLRLIYPCRAVIMSMKNTSERYKANINAKKIVKKGGWIDKE